MRSAAASPGQKKFSNPRAELMRLRAIYRDAVLRGAVRISGKDSLRAMRLLVGPDCAYHLYSRVAGRL